MITPQQIDDIIQIATNYRIRRLILLGSADTTPDHARDVDLACDGIAGWKLHEFGAAIEHQLNMPVDVISLSPSTRMTRYVEKKGNRLI